MALLDLPQQLLGSRLVVGIGHHLAIKVDSTNDQVHVFVLCIAVPHDATGAMLEAQAGCQ
jgi:hypothetical protein